MADEPVDEIRAWAKQYAREHNLVLNPDERVRVAVIRGLARNQIRYGGRCCLWRIRKGMPLRGSSGSPSLAGVAFHAPCRYPNGHPA
jgi:ferredoxin-thioredoxin reductase catalytic subunit